MTRKFVKRSIFLILICPTNTVCTFSYFSITENIPFKKKKKGEGPQPGLCCCQPEGSSPPQGSNRRGEKAVVPATHGGVARWCLPGEAGLEGHVCKAVAQLGDDPINFGVQVGFQGKVLVLGALEMLLGVRGGRGR